MSNNINWQIGCSGFHYKEWKEFFYPPKLPQRLWFDHYTKSFNTLELNVTFYRFPKLSSLQNWYNTSPDNFHFSVKVPQIITHYKKFKETEQLVEDFYAVIKEGLGNKLGAVLFQLPPQLQYSEALLQQIINSVHSGYNNVIEFRHNSWWKEDVYQQLAARQICFCGSSYPKLPDDVIINIDTVYYRFHGVPVLYKSQYGNTFLQKIVDTINNNVRVKKAFIYFNNTWGPAALNNGLWLKNYCNAQEKHGIINLPSLKNGEVYQQ